MLPTKLPNHVGNSPRVLLDLAMALFMALAQIAGAGTKKPTKEMIRPVIEAAVAKYAWPLNVIREKTEIDARDTLKVTVWLKRPRPNAEVQKLAEDAVAGLIKALMAAGMDPKDQWLGAQVNVSVETTSTTATARGTCGGVR